MFLILFYFNYFWAPLGFYSTFHFSEVYCFPLNFEGTLISGESCTFPDFVDICFLFSSYWFLLKFSIFLIPVVLYLLLNTHWYLLKLPPFRILVVLYFLFSTHRFLLKLPLFWFGCLYILLGTPWFQLKISTFPIFLLFTFLLSNRSFLVRFPLFCTLLFSLTFEHALISSENLTFSHSFLFFASFWWSFYSARFSAFSDFVVVYFFWAAINAVWSTNTAWMWVAASDIITLTSNSSAMRS